MTSGSSQSACCRCHSLQQSEASWRRQARRQPPSWQWRRQTACASGICLLVLLLLIPAQPAATEVWASAGAMTAANPARQHRHLTSNNTSLKAGAGVSHGRRALAAQNSAADMDAAAWSALAGLGPGTALPVSSGFGMSVSGIGMSSTSQQRLGGISISAGRGGRALLAQGINTQVASSGVEVYSPAQRINAMPTQFFRVNFGGPTLIARPLDLVDISGASE